MPQDAPIITVTDTRPVKLDLACGQHPREGFKGVDLYTGDERVDLLSFPWPWADNSVDEVHCSHFVEHIPMCYIGDDGAAHLLSGPGRKDAFFAFFDELHRILKPGAIATIIVPYLRSERAFQDPTHRRFICENTFLYLNADWRKANGLDHYTGACDFAFAAGSPVRIVDQGESLRHPEVVQQRMAGLWNIILDIKVEMVKR